MPTSLLRMAGHQREMEEIERLLQAAGVSWETVVSAMDDSLTGDEDVLARSTLGQVISALARLGYIGHAARGAPIAWSWDGLAGWGAPAGTIVYVEPVWIEDETDRPSGWAVQTRAGDTPDDAGEAVWIPWSIVEATRHETAMTTNTARGTIAATGRHKGFLR